MLRIRYMIVDHPASSDGLLHYANGRMQHVPFIHSNIPLYHWVRMDESTIFLKGTYYNEQHKRLLSAAKVTVLPSTFSRQTVKAAINEQGNHHHHDVLHRHQAPYDDQTITSDLVDWFAKYESGIFDHES